MSEDRRQTTEDRSSPRFRLGKRYSSERRIRPLAALPVDTVREWALAAPKSLIKNIYSPTELTIACTAYRWEHASSPEECEQGIVPIGEPFEGIELLVVDEQCAKRSRGLMAS